MTLAHVTLAGAEYSPLAYVNDFAPRICKAKIFRPPSSALFYARDGECLQAHLLRHGAAFLSKPDRGMDPVLVDAMLHARTRRLGCWEFGDFLDDD